MMPKDEVVLMIKDKAYLIPTMDMVEVDSDVEKKIEMWDTVDIIHIMD